MWPAFPVKFPAPQAPLWSASMQRHASCTRSIELLPVCWRIESLCVCMCVSHQVYIYIYTGMPADYLSLNYHTWPSHGKLNSPRWSRKVDIDQWSVALITNPLWVVNVQQCSQCTILNYIQFIWVNIRPFILSETWTLRACMCIVWLEYVYVWKDPCTP